MDDTNGMASRVLDLLWRCLSSHTQMYAGNAEAYLEAASELSRLDVPHELPADSRFPKHMETLPPVQRVTAVLFDAGNYLVGIQRDAEAIPYLRRVVELTPDDADAHRELAVALNVTKQTEEALKHLQTYVHLRPSDPSGFCGSGDCLIALGRLQEGIAAYKMAGTIAPDHPLVVKRFAWLRQMGIAE